MLGWEAAVFTKSIYEEAFARDGSHRDLYVRSTSLNDCHDFLKFLNSTDYRLSLQTDGTPTRMPSDVTPLFSADTPRLPQIYLGGITLNCHFFLEDEIELDLDPEELTDDDDDSKADAILAFMVELGEALRKPVLMTAENAPDAVIFRFDPEAKQVTYEPASAATTAATVRLPEDIPCGSSATASFQSSAGQAPDFSWIFDATGLV
jgi:hypothetical protein